MVAVAAMTNLLVVDDATLATTRQLTVILASNAQDRASGARTPGHDRRANPAAARVASATEFARSVVA